MSADNHKRPRIVVVGGGIAGLATAYLIRQLGREQGLDPELIILEARDLAGGSTRTDREQGYICEWGPNGFLDNEPATLNLVSKLGMSDRLVKANERASRRYIYHHGKLHDVPGKPGAFLKSDILPLSAKLRMAMELVIKAKRNGQEESVYDFGRRRLGENFAKYLLDPMVSGIFAGNAHELSLPAVFPKMVEMETQYGGLFRAMIAKGKEARRSGVKSGGPAGASATLTTFKNGMGELTEKLAAELGAVLRTGVAASIIEKPNGHLRVRMNGTAIEADSVVLACPSHAAAPMISQVSTKTAETVRDIQYAPVDVVCHGHAVRDVDHPIDGFGVLIPRGEGFRMLGCLWCDSIFPGQSPEGVHLLRTMVGGAHDPSVSAMTSSELEQVVRAEHSKLLGSHGDPVFRKVFRHPNGIAQYTLGHPQRMAEVDRLERAIPGLYFTGASYRGVSVNGCVKDAFRVAEGFLEFWRSRC